MIDVRFEKAPNHAIGRSVCLALDQAPSFLLQHYPVARKAQTSDPLVEAGWPADADPRLLQTSEPLVFNSGGFSCR
jgi:hypothetical protein